MLDVAYEAVEDLPPGTLARIDEERGWVRLRLDKAAPLSDVVSRLNVELGVIVNSARWFQLWDDGEIVSCNSPARPLQVVFRLERRETYGIFFEERKGLLSIFIDPALSVEEFAAAANPATRTHLNRGCWFQLYDGVIVDQSAEPMSQV